MKFGRKLLAGVEPYTPGEQPKDGSVIKLNTNENPYPPAPQIMDALRSLSGDALRKYPDPVAQELRTLCAERYGYPDASWIVAGNGMDELLAMAIRTFSDPGDTILTVNPTYTLYETLAALHGARMAHVDLDETYQLDEAFFAAKGRLCFLPRPNAPSGVSAARTEVERFAAAFDGIVVIDEAYVDFADDDCMDLPNRFDNVIVMRTFSKSFSMAGMRLGIAVANPGLITELFKTKDSYNLNAFTQAAGCAAMRAYDYMVEQAAKVKATRARLTAALNAMGFAVPPSQTNFVLAKWEGSPAARTIFTDLKERKIFVRYFDRLGLQDCLRISIGTDAEIDALLAALHDIIKTSKT